MKIRYLYGKLCVDGVLKDENNIVERKGLTCSLDFPNVFKTEWIKIILRRIHDDSVWLENGLPRTLKASFNV